MKLRFLKIWIVAALLLAGWNASSTPASFEFTGTFNVTNWIPDGDVNGLADTREITDVPGVISHLSVSLAISGGFIGDFYVHLVHDSGFTVLLNRVGANSANQFGYSASGLSITLDDDAEHDVHWYELFSPGYDGDGQLLGTWQPDGRSADPMTVDEWTDRNTALESFYGLNPNGNWTLFVADLSSGDQGQLLNWRIEMQTVPEPNSAAFFALSLGLLALARRR